MAYCSTIKNEILSFTGKWMELENIMLSEIRQAQKDKGHMFSLVCRRQIQIQIIYIYITRENMFPKVKLLQESKGRGKKNME
jgi:hypothetical protein